MNKKQLIIAIIVIAVLGGVYMITQRSENSSWTAAGETVRKQLVADLDVNAVTKISFEKGNSSSVIEKKGDIWKVSTNSDYPADFSKISNFLIKLKDLKVAQTIKVGKSMFGKLNLTKDGDQSGTSVQLFTKDGSCIHQIIVGKEHMPKQAAPQPMMFGGPRADGRYLFVEGQKMPVLVCDAMSEVSTDSATWLSKEFINIKDITSISYASSDNSNKWSLNRDKADGDFTCSVAPKDGEEVNSPTVTSVSSAFNYFSFEAALPKSAIAFDSADTVVVKTADGFAYTLKIQKKDNKFYLAPAVAATFKEQREVTKDEKEEDKEKLNKEFTDNLTKLRKKLAKEQFYNSWVYEISSYKAQSLIKKAADFVKKKEVKKDDK